MFCKNWVLAELDKNKALETAEKFDIDSFLAIMFQVRGIDDENVNEFLSDDVELESPMVYADMDKAVERILRAVKNFEKICVYGDYDADGVTSTVLLYSYLNMYGANVIYFVPNRFKDGYGLNVDSIKKLKEQEVDLIITVDNGIAAFDEIEYANSIGMEVVVTDHHEVPEKLPNAVAVVDPHRNDCMSKFKNLAGVGVVFKLICALEGDAASMEEILSEYADLVAIGTFGDIVPLRGENRIFAKIGLNQIKQLNRLGLKHLLEASDILKSNIDSSKLCFQIVPRINAAGRMESAEAAIKLLLSESEDEAYYYANHLNELNEKRKDLQQEIFLKVEEFLEKNPERLLNRIIVAQGEGFNTGVIGIVASKVVNKYSKPCIIISTNEGVGRGSGRSVEGFSLYDATEVCSDYLIKFGGHPMAVGFDLPDDKIEDFVRDVNEFASNVGDMPVTNIHLDCKLNPCSLSIDFVDIMRQLEPFGSSNPSPVFGLFNMKIDDIYPVGGGKHLKITLTRDNTSLKVIKFNTTVEQFGFDIGDLIDVAVTLKKDFYKQVPSLSIIVDDVKASGVERETIISDEKLYEAIKRNEVKDCEIIKSIIPNRDEFASVYRFLKRHNGWKSTIEALWVKLGEENMRICKLEFIIDILNQLDVIGVRRHPDRYVIFINGQNKKVDLESASILKELKAIGGI